MIQTPKARRSVTLPRGFRAAGTTCGIKRSGLPDLALIVADDLCAAAGVFTTNKVPGAPVVVAKRHIRRGHARAIVCNSGNSNVCTGKQGERDAVAMCKAVARAVGCDPHEVLPSSTGVIGVPLPLTLIERGIATAAMQLSRGLRADNAAARAILTTDLVAKSAKRSITLDGKTVKLAGIAKGSGMIAPNMATMLAFITTDAAIAPAALRAALRQAVSESFNRISVDHDTSTSDSVQILASGRAGHQPIDKPAGEAYETFLAALVALCKELAYEIVRDGEGATKVFRVVVQGAASQRDADRVGYTTVGSPLVKSAVHGGDPNWGRLVMAVGRSGAKVKPDKLDITVGDMVVGQGGQPISLNRTEQRRLHRIMARREITFTINLNLGRGESEWLGCDLSRQYVAINADYTT